MENDKQTTKQTFIKVYRYGRFDLTYAIKQELKFRAKVLAETGREMVRYAIDDFTHAQ